jgi:hypothetical protein
MPHSTAAAKKYKKKKTKKKKKIKKKKEKKTYPSCRNIAPCIPHMHCCSQT